LTCPAANIGGCLAGPEYFPAAGYIFGGFCIPGKSRYFCGRKRFAFLPRAIFFTPNE
jgi:hypothetical protein